MKIRTVYTPTDSNGNPFNLKTGIYDLADIEKLGTDLVSAGVTPSDALAFNVDADGVLSVVTSKTV